MPLAGLLSLAFPVAALSIDVPIAYESRRGPDAPRNPVVTMSVAGRKVRLLLDTGAGGVWFDRAFLRGLGVRGVPDKPDEDHRGPVQTESLPPLEVSAGHWKRRVSIARAYAMPVSLRKSGVYGIANPARLLDAGAAILDFPSSRLRITDLEGDALRAWLKKDYPRFEFEELDRLSGHLPPLDDPDQGFHSVVSGALVGHGEGPLLVDSGAGGVTFRDSYVGKAEGTLLRAPQTVRLGGREIDVGEVRVGPHRTGPDVIGSVGMRALRGLIVVLPAGRAKVILGFPPPRAP